MTDEEKTKAESEVKPDEAKDVETDYKTLAEIEKSRADAEKARADAAEALIIKNKKLASRQEDNDDEERPLTLKDLKNVIPDLLKTKEDNSAESNAYEEATRKAKELEAKNAELLRALKNKDNVSKDTANTQRDGLPKNEPKLPDNSPLKEYKYMGNGVYSKKLANGKTLFKKPNAGAGEPKTWVA